MTADNAPLVCGPAVYVKGGPIKFSRYPADRSIAILIGGDAKATVCLPEGSEPAGEHGVWLKGWSENEGVPQALERAGIVTLSGRQARTGYCFAEHAVLTPAAIAQLRREDPLKRMFATGSAA